MEQMKRKVYLVRHAESIWNRERRVQGTCQGIPLSPIGRLQAQTLGKRFKQLSFDSVYCSDADRANETARIALGDDYPIVLMSELRELSLGEWEGRLISEIREEIPGEVEKWYLKPTAVHIRGQEDLSSFRERAIEVMNRIIASSDSGNILVISHGGVICAYLTHLFNMELDDLWCFSLPNASITTIVLDFRPRLRSFGDTFHLEDDALGHDGMPSAL